MIATVTLNPALDKVFILPTRSIERLNYVERGISIPGGDGINSAYAIQALGTEAIVMGFIGGIAGKFIEEELGKTQISTNFTYIEKQTRTDHIILNKRNRVLTQINEKGPWIKPKEIESFNESFKRMLSRCEMVLFSGSVPQGVGADIYARLISITQEKKVRTVLNATKEALLHGIETGPYMVFADLKGIDVLMGVKINTIKKLLEAAQKILDKGTKIVVFNFNDNKLVVTSEKVWKINLPDIKVVNSVGMEDALIGGMMHILKDSEDLFEAIRCGAAASIASALQVEAKVKSKEQVEQFLDKVEIKELNLS
ncbi:1-phosphofructokinase family hexose kinase [Candidatus Oleimmundimicrobium sp.]|uniref:1-phosphofructokinase family hexose kinase n=1 Tax=Candidatus Oleimmundimicrobium sp. TaxID=3060597 RepID=UPI0027188B2A|nr:1-phosphofructokinase family hexose kinase [Candidatus Oleimmundimicrobium sp.]MDO8885482.1 1-phosphofructokinase family hexose kinase [Candidatus Oleimmundimicrobium sp.]